ncbi:hypothetical protein Y032_0015g2580 [Ancylostoma ceylanicum]|uniref:DOMON domain-containing protein n=1 Tax=Ancylostoma ceylanicum TaxID=53326 RepID=A0A016V770_9BILA|nr:hypothetical protein Y032_0015g2580 [Ancylostoma ceylanicum]
MLGGTDRCGHTYDLASPSAPYKDQVLRFKSSAPGQRHHSDHSTLSPVALVLESLSDNQQTIPKNAQKRTSVLNDGRFHFRYVLIVGGPMSAIDHPQSIRIKNEVATATAMLGAVSICVALEVFDDKDCGKSKGCIFVPENCIADNRCLINVTYKMIGSKLEMEISGKVLTNDEYTAVGLSKDSKMGDDFLVCCIKSGGKIFPALALHEQREHIEFLNGNGLEIINTYYKDNRLYCKIRQAKEQFARHSFSLEKPYHILLALGSYQNKMNPIRSIKSILIIDRRLNNKLSVIYSTILIRQELQYERILIVSVVDDVSVPAFHYHSRWNSFVTPKISLAKIAVITEERREAHAVAGSNSIPGKKNAAQIAFKGLMPFIAMGVIVVLQFSM